ncbi:MAG: helicase-associated domain-containing protein, partial [Chloroflexi bacterium]|nr:helicase-associated domain-containing protein [Chloroflexota bacterium]
LYWLERFRLAELRGNKIQPAERWEQWRTSSLPEQAVLVLNSWIFEDETELSIALPGVTSPVMAVRRARLKLLKWLQELPPGEWFTLNSFLRRVLARDPYFLRSREAILALTGEAGIDDLYASWRRQDGVILLNELYSAPLTAGFIEVGWEAEPKRQESPTHFRVSSFGSDLLQQLRIATPAPEKIDAPDDSASARPAARKPGRPRSPIAVPRKGEISLAEFFHENRIRLKEGSQQEEHVLLVQPNLEIVLLQFNPRAAYAVGRFAQPVSFDQVGTFQITAESVRSAASRGIEFSEMKATLDRYGTGPTPQNVEYQMNDWASAVRKVRFERGTVVEVDSPGDLETLLGSKSMRSRLIRRISPTAALLSVGEDVQALGKILEPQGFSWTQPEDWDAREEAAYIAIHKTLKRFESPKPSWGWKY